MDTRYDVGATFIDRYRYASSDVFELTGMTLQDNSHPRLYANRDQLYSHLNSLVGQIENTTHFRVIVLAVTAGVGDFDNYYRVQIHVRGHADSAIQVRNQVNDAVALDFGPFFVESGFRDAVNLPADPNGGFDPRDSRGPTGYQHITQGNSTLTKEAEELAKHTREARARDEAKYAAEPPLRKKEAKRQAIANAKVLGPSWLRWVPDPIYAWGNKHPFIVVLLGLGIIIEVLVDIIAKLL